MANTAGSNWRTLELSALQIKVNYPYKELAKILPNGSVTVLLHPRESAAMAICSLPGTLWCNTSVASAAIRAFGNSQPLSGPCQPALHGDFQPTSFLFEAMANETGGCHY